MLNKILYVLSKNFILLAILLFSCSILILDGISLYQILTFHKDELYLIEDNNYFIRLISSCIVIIISLICISASLVFAYKEYDKYNNIVYRGITNSNKEEDNNKNNILILDNKIEARIENKHTNEVIQEGTECLVYVNNKVITIIINDMVVVIKEEG